MKQTGYMVGILMAVAFLALAIPSFAGHSVMKSIFGKQIEGSGDAVTQVREVAEFDRLTLAGAYDIHLTIGKKQSVKITFDDNLVDLITAKVKRGKLVLDSDESYSSDLNCRVDITVPSLERISISGSADIIADGFDGGDFELRVTGSGDFEASGELDLLEINISGSGSADTRELDAKEVEVVISGSGDAKVRAIESFDGTISGSGNIVYYGHPDYTTESIHGSGNIRQR